MKVIGLTGGIGMGKSTSARFLEELGIRIIDTDALARKLVGPSQPALSEIAAVFGSEVIDETGALRRDVMARIVFADENKRRLLESILHPRIRERWVEHVHMEREAGVSVVVVVIPLLYETEAAPLFDFVICSACSEATQRNRLLARNWSEAHLQSRIKSQWPIEMKMDCSSFVVWTEGALEIHQRQISKLIPKLC